jgi:hypothetical protein
MADINWVQIGVGFACGVFACYTIHDLVFPVSKKDE